MFGARAGRGGGVRLDRRSARVRRGLAADEVRRLEQDLLGKDPGTESIAAIRQEPSDHGGGGRHLPDRTRHDQGHGCAPRAPGRVGNVGIADTSRSFNTELLAALELANMLDIGECILQSGLQREESRGAHQRTDFPERDDGRFLIHQLVHRGPDGNPRIEHLPVTITRWPPGERIYGR